MVFSLLFLLLAQPLIASNLKTIMVQGVEAFNHRADGHEGPAADPQPISRAIGAFQQALEQDPKNLEARWQLLRAMIFKGHYAMAGAKEKKKIFQQGKKVAEER